MFNICESGLVLTIKLLRSLLTAQAMLFDNLTGLGIGRLTGERINL